MPVCDVSAGKPAFLVPRDSATRLGGHSALGGDGEERMWASMCGELKAVTIVQKWRETRGLIMSDQMMVIDVIS